jgi:hypothetical protein
MSFRTFIEEQQRRPSQQQVRVSKVPELEESEDDNYEDAPEPPRRAPVREEYQDPREKSLEDEVDFYKQRLYKKIDSCFVRYGLEGLKRIDEGIAKSIERYINNLKGERGFNINPREIEDPEPTPRPAMRVPQRPANPIQKPVVKKPEPTNEGQFNSELIDAILNKVIPETEIHEVPVKSSIRRPEPVQEEVLAPEDSYQDIPVQEDAPAQTYDIMNEMVDDSTAREAESVDLFVPPVIEEPTEADMNSEAELDAPIVEEAVTPIEMNAAEPAEPTPKKKRKKKAEE